MKLHNESRLGMMLRILVNAMFKCTQDGAEQWGETGKVCFVLRHFPASERLCGTLSAVVSVRAADALSGGNSVRLFVLSITVSEAAS